MLVNKNWRSLILTVVSLLVLSYEQTRGENVTPPPLGELVDVGGYRVHLYSIGSGSPTVVITGAGSSFDWGLVQRDVAKFARVCTYDHSGVALAVSCHPPTRCVAACFCSGRHRGPEDSPQTQASRPDGTACGQAKINYLARRRIGLQLDAAALLRPSIVAR